MILNDTIPMMDNEDYQERFKAEFYQLKIRIDKFQAMLNNWENLDFTPKCSLYLLNTQLF